MVMCLRLPVDCGHGISLVSGKRSCVFVCVFLYMAGRRSVCVSKCVCVYCSFLSNILALIYETNV